VSQPLDSVDKKILTLLQHDAELSSSELAERVGISQSPCWRRVQRLRSEGYIKSMGAVVDWRKLGFSLQIFVQAKMARHSDEARAEFFRQIETIPEIIECYTVLGEMDVMMKVIAPDVAWFQEFIFCVLMKLPGVDNLKSVVTLAEAKKSRALPVSVRKIR